MRANAVVSNRSLLRVITLTVALAVLGTAPARADEDDPPTRAARLSYIQGSVSFQPAGTQDWVAAPVNRPLTTGDQLWADSDSRAELQLDGSALRVGAATSLGFLNLGDHVTQVQLSAGTLIVRVRRLDDQDTYEVDTPNLAFTVLRPGTYRLAVDPNAGTTTIDLRHGQGEVTGGGTAYSLYEGEDDTFAGTDQLVETAQYASPAPNEFDTWSDRRDDRWDHSVSARYVSPGVVGYEDLDDQGTWSATPPYGYVWYPRGLEPGWAPYQTGHWAYVPPWGYTWVDDQAWGFAPFHYGRWIWNGTAWGWVPAPPPAPGAVYVRPVYAPALVAWVGTGATVAWFALGPREVFVPSYPVSRSYVEAVNVSNTNVRTTVVNNVYNTTIVNKTVVNNVTYVNRTAPGAVVATTTEALTTSAPVASHRVSINARELASAPVHALAPAVVPTRKALLGTGRAVNARPPASVATRPVVARTAPPPSPPSFEQRLKTLQSNGGRPLSVAQVRQLQPPAATSAAVHVKVAPPAKTLITPKVAQAATHAPANRPAPPPAAVHPAAPATHVAETPPPSRAPPPSQANSVLERQHLQEQQRLQAQQVAERQRVQQQQETEHQQLAKQQADEAHRRQLEQQHQQQTQQLQKQQALEQQQLEERQKEQHRQQQVQASTAKKNAPPPKRPPPEAPPH